MNVFHMSTDRLAGRPAGLDELTAGAGDRRCRRLANTALLGMQEPCRAGTCIPARTVYYYYYYYRSSNLVRFVHLYDEGKRHVVGIRKLIRQRGTEFMVGHSRSVPAHRRGTSHHGRYFRYESVQIQGVHVRRGVLGGQREDDT